MSEYLSVFVTAASREEGEKIALILIEEGLAACVTSMAAAQSVYRWQGKVEKVEEYVLVIKITADKFGALEKRVKQLHSYECPCIVAWPIVAGNRDYLSWIEKSQDGDLSDKPR